MEFETTKKVIRAVPDDKKSYKPEAKSMTAHELAWHIASSEIFFLDAVSNGKFDTGGEQAAAPTTIEAILEWYESNHKDRMAKLQNLTADKIVNPVGFFWSDGIPGGSVFESYESAYIPSSWPTFDVLRPMGTKVPSIYGGRKRVVTLIVTVNERGL